MAINHTDTELIRAVRANSREGFELLYQEYGSILYGVILKTVTAEAIAQQLLIDSILEIWKRIDEFDASGIQLLQWIILKIIRPTLARYPVVKQVNP